MNLIAKYQKYEGFVRKVNCSIKVRDEAHKKQLEIEEKVGEIMNLRFVEIVEK